MKKQTKKNEEALFIYGLYCKLIANEKHYTTLQVKYRKNAAYWLLVIFSSIGIAYSSEEINIPFNQLLTTVAICIIGIIGNCYFWYEDLFSLERFLNLNHLEAYQLENKYQWLPKIHHQFVYHSHKLLLNNKILFYVGSNSILFIVISISFFLYLYKSSILLTALFLSLFSISFLVLTRILFIKTYQNELLTLKTITYDRR